uniref:Divergent protein kinase domain 2Ab n=1 Tax=Cyprinus carpio carpio TaxID=630221 RepID=A0A9J8B2R0_CYPCA
MLRFLPLKLGRLYRCLKLLFVIGLFVILLMNTHNLFASFQKNELTDRRFINLNKCPACFGTSWCRKFMNGQISFETWGRLRFLDVFNVKNVFFAQYGEPREGTRRIVLKRLGSNQELTDIDQKICKRATGRTRCDLIQAMYKTEFARLNGDVRLLTPDVVEGWSDLVHCPSQRLLDRIVRRYAETKDSGSFLLKNLKDTERMQLLMTLAFNPEPLVLQSFPSDEGWPFAKYLGACGRMVAVNYVGEELWSFFNAPWEKRVDLAKQLMDIAEQLTNNDFDFALYLLDVSFDNFAVGPRDGKVIVVDAENVVVADKRLIKQNCFHLLFVSSFSHLCHLCTLNWLIYCTISLRTTMSGTRASLRSVTRRPVFPSLKTCCARGSQWTTTITPYVKIYFHDMLCGGAAPADFFTTPRHT